MEHVLHALSGSLQPEICVERRMLNETQRGLRLNAAKEFELTPFSLRCIGGHVRFEALVAISEP